MPTYLLLMSACDLKFTYKSSYVDGRWVEDSEGRWVDRYPAVNSQYLLPGYVRRSTNDIYTEEKHWTWSGKSWGGLGWKEEIELPIWEGDAIYIFGNPLRNYRREDKGASFSDLLKFERLMIRKGVLLDREQLERLRKLKKKERREYRLRAKHWKKRQVEQGSAA